MTAIRIVLADDHPDIRSGLRLLLKAVPDIEVVGEAKDGLEALRRVRQLEPDVLLLDMEMPALKGLDVARRLRALDAPVRVLALSAYDDKQYILGLLANGAAGYLIKEEAPEILVEAIRGVARGESGWVSPQVAARIAAWGQEEQPEQKP